MALTCLFFAQSALWMKSRSLEIQLPDPVSLLAVLEKIPEFAPVLERRSCLKVAVNRVRANFETEVHDGDEVAFLPPFSGG